MALICTRKKQTQGFLVVVVKWCHRAIVLLHLEK